MNAKMKRWIEQDLPMIVEVPHRAEQATAYRLANVDDVSELYNWLTHNTAFWFEFGTLADILHYLKQTKREHRLTGSNHHIYHARKAITRFLRNHI